MTEDNNVDRICGIFSLKGIYGTNKIKIIHEQNVNLKMHEYMSDTLIERYEISKNVYGEIYKCNITDTYLMSSKKLPMWYVSVIYEKPLRRMLLFKLYLCFTINKKISKMKELLDDEIEGLYDLELVVENNKKIIDNDMGNYPGNKRIQNKLMSFTKAEEMKDMITILINDINKKLEDEYQKEFEYYTPPKNVISLKNYKL